MPRACHRTEGPLNLANRRDNKRIPCVPRSEAQSPATSNIQASLLTWRKSGTRKVKWLAGGIVVRLFSAKCKSNSRANAAARSLTTLKNCGNA